MKLFKRAMAIVMIAALLLGVCALTGCGEPEKPSTKKTHDPVTFQVTGKDKYEPHKFKDGKCTMCDTTTVFEQEPMNKSHADMLKNACDQQGTVEKITYTYTTKDGAQATKDAYVYLPYGYNAGDTATKYDVLYMLHGKGLNEGYWFAQGTYSPEDSIYTGGFGTQNVLDHMMKDGLAKKAILVAVSNYKTGTQEEDSDFGKELTESIMPYIVEHYNTYAADGTAESLKANREHQGYCGLSMGSMYSFSVILSDYVDYFAWIGSYSGSSFGEDTWKAIGENISANWDKAPIKYWFASVGGAETDKNYPGDPFASYRTVLANCPQLVTGENAMFMTTTNAGHNYAAWITSLYNCMLVFFK